MWRRGIGCPLPCSILAPSTSSSALLRSSRLLSLVWPRLPTAAAAAAAAMSTRTEAQQAQITSQALQIKLRELQLKHAQAHAASAAGAAATGAAATDKMAAVTYPLRRRWLSVQPQGAAVSGASVSASPPTPPSGVPLTFLSYNILAQSLVRRDMFPYSSRSSLKVAFRKDNLLAELLAADADVLCLQEVDADLVHTFWGVKLGQAGYKYEYGARRDFAKHGCAIFYKKAKFEKFASSVVQFADELGAPYHALPDNLHADPAQRKASVYEEMSRPNVAMLMGMRVKEAPAAAGSAAASSSTPLGVYVTNTHLFWDPRYRFVRLKQCQTLLDKLAALQAEHQTQYPSLLMGDFNVTPDNIIYHYLTDRNELERNEEQWSKFLTPAEHGMIRGEEGAAPVPAASEASNSGISSASLSRLMGAVSLDASTAAAAAAAAASLPRPRSPTAGQSAIHSLRTELFTHADGSVKVRDVEAHVDHSSDSSVLRLSEVKKVLHHSKQLPLLRSLYADYGSLVPADARASVAKSRASSYCRWSSEAPYTNYTEKFKGTLDYIFVPTLNPATDPSDPEAADPCAQTWAGLLASPTCFLYPTHVLEVPPEEQVNTHVALPNDTISSDHVCIAAKIVISRTPPPPKQTATTSAVAASAASASSPATSPSSAATVALAKSIAASLSPASPPTTPPAAAASPQPAAGVSFPPFNPASFRAQTRAKHVGSVLHYLPTVGSTMDVCKEALFGAKASNPQSGTIWLADEQTKGRGRIEGRTWASPSCANIYMTLLIQLTTADGFEQLRKMNQSVCIAVAQSIEKALSSATGIPAAHLPAQLRPRIKWPNDVWIGNKKCSGMLIDVEQMGGTMNVIPGVGINVHEDFSSHPDADLRKSATSVSQSLRDFQRSGLAPPSNPATTTPVTRESILATFVSSLESLAPLSLGEVLSVYSRYDMLIGHRVLVMPKKKEDATAYYEAQAVAYSPDGYLVVKTDAGETKELVAEEVTIRPAA